MLPGRQLAWRGPSPHQAAHYLRYDHQALWQPAPQTCSGCFQCWKTTQEFLVRPASRSLSPVWPTSSPSTTWASTPKPNFKRMIKKHVLNYWEEFLRKEAEDPRYSSLEYFKPRYISLTSPHPLWTTAGSSPANVSMASIQAQMVSGWYRCEALYQVLKICSCHRRPHPQHQHSYQPRLLPVPTWLFISTTCYSSNREARPGCSSPPF